MKLKTKFLNWSAGRPVAILNKKTAEMNSINVDERISIKRDGKTVIAVVDIASDILNEHEIILSKEVFKGLKVRKGHFVEVEIAEKPESIILIHKKMSKQILSAEELKKIMNDVSKNALTEAEIAYLISSIYNSKMSLKETADLTKAIVETGKVLKFKGKVADKHSIGGIPGRTTPIVVSICAAAGLKVPKTSSRAITTAAGTADAIEVLCKVDFNELEVKKIVNKINACLVWGGSLNLAPADDKIIQVERILNLDPESQLLASILAKKISIGAKYVIIDIPYGKTAKVDKKQALNLKKKFETLGKYFKMKINAILSPAKEPVGNGVGPALEIIDVLNVLERKDKCHLLEDKSIFLASKLLELTGKANKKNSEKIARDILNSGRALKKFKEIVKAQKGSINFKKKFKFHKSILSKRTGKIYFIDIKKINLIARASGCPIDKFSGLYLHKHLEDNVKKGEKLITIYSESKSELNSALKKFYILKPMLIS